MSLSTPATGFDIKLGLPISALDASMEAQIWLLLCARTLTEVDPALSDSQAGDIALALLASPEHRTLDAVAAAYLWLARTSEGVDGEQLV